MLKAILFDLDDTLLGNHMDSFIPNYFALLSQYGEQFMPREQFIEEIMIATQAMVVNTDPATSNRDVFWQCFAARNPFDPDEMEATFEAFYRNEFWALQAVTRPRQCAADLITACQNLGLKVVIATNPMFPRTAVEARLSWAGVPVSEFAYDLVTTYENMHATKPHSAYFAEVFANIGVAPGDALMVGDDWENDIEPAAAAGCFTFWIPPNGEDSPPDAALVSRFGSLADLYRLVVDGWLADLA
jgi:HAD superfamily hydrolase (TIGR01549 family)